MDPLYVPYLHFRLVLKLLTLHKCHCSHPVHIHDSNHAHCLMSLQNIVMVLPGQWSLLHTERENNFTAEALHDQKTVF